MAIHSEDRENMRLRFTGLWRGEHAESVWQAAYTAFYGRYPTTVTLAEFKQLCGLFGNKLDDVGGGGDRPHAFRLQIG